MVRFPRSRTSNPSIESPRKILVANPSVPLRDPEGHVRHHIKIPTDTQEVGT